MTRSSCEVEEEGRGKGEDRLNLGGGLDGLIRVEGWGWEDGEIEGGGGGSRGW